MKKGRFLFIIMVCFLVVTSASGKGLPAQMLFEQYMSQAQAFADTYPREKAYLHFDNTSYYVGDTIWFKAYVTIAETQEFSPVSRPLYVELVDQVGHIADRQIVKLIHGEGCGQFILPNSLLSGYYEVRAYTRWMLGFSEPQYFSRTFPVYKLSNSDQLERNISTYKLSPSMKNRPERIKGNLSLRFFPEGGLLVEGVKSRVAFKAESNTEEEVKLEGGVYTKEGQEIVKIETLHAGMGYFDYTPSLRPAVAKVRYNGKAYDFELPKSLPSGYVMKAVNEAGALSVKIACNSNTVQDTLAVFISHQGRPYVYQMINCRANEPQQIAVLTRDLPAGILQVSLVNRSGHILCERFVFSFPKTPLQISASGLKKVYNPYSPICCELQTRDAKGEPVSGKLSVSICDAVRSDYLEYDNNLFTDLLLTSDLKGYIHQPGYYFTEITPRKLEELDLLMLVHGWRKYNMEQLMGILPFVPLQSPEPQLILHGQIKSTIFKNELKNMDLSVMVKKDSAIITGHTVTDEEGRFSIPLEDFEESLEAVFQTRRLGKKHNKDASVLIDRNFSPMLRAYNYIESHPQWTNTELWQQRAEKNDSLYMDSIRRIEGDYLLNEVVVKSKHKKGSNMVTNINEQSIDAYYDVRQSVDRLRDQGKLVSTIPELMEKLSPHFYWNRTNNEYSYRQKPICYIMNDKILSGTEIAMMLSEVDGLASIIVCEGHGGIADEIIQNSKLSDVNELEIRNLDKYMIFYLIPLPRHNVLNKHEGAALGTRQTVIQGYTPVLECYSPAYPNKELYIDKVDKRRTLYWNPSVQTDENGKAIIKCYNNQYSTPLIIHAETLIGGRIGTMVYSTIGE